MKTFDTPLLAVYQSNTATLAYAMKIVRKDKKVFGFTSAQTDTNISGIDYSAAQGLAVSDIVASSGLGVDNMELTTLDDGTLFTTADVLTGLWRNARFLIFKYNWKSSSDGVEDIMAGSFGEVKRRQNTIVIELRGLQQYLQQSVGNASSKTCRARFADYPKQAGNNRCGINVVTWTDALTVSAVTDRRVFVATKADPRAADWYNQGLLVWLTGNNTGRFSRVKTYNGSQLFGLYDSLPFDVQIGDTCSAVAGCQKRLEEDCATKFNNVLNFQGEPHRPGVDAVTSPVTPVV